jgi:hypothetical protein
MSCRWSHVHLFICTMIPVVRWCGICVVVIGIVGVLSGAMILEFFALPILWFIIARAIYRRFFPAPFINPAGKFVLISVRAAIVTLSPFLSHQFGSLQTTIM